VKVTERKFRDDGGRVVAYLRQRMFIVLREHVRTYPEDDRGMPFTRVEITTHVTPDIALPDLVPGSKPWFWVEVVSGGRPVPFQFHCIGTDRSGNTHDFTTPLMFVSRTDASSVAVLDAYNDSSDPRPSTPTGATRSSPDRRSPSPNKQATRTRAWSST